MALATALVCLMAFAGSSSADLLAGASVTRPSSPPPPHLVKASRRALAGASERRLLSRKLTDGGDSNGKPELDFSTEDVQRSKFQAPDFVFSFPTAAQTTQFGSVKGESVNNRPALATLPNGGVTQTLVTLEACAINQPHSHPRGTEFSFVTKGEVFFGFIEENFSGATMTGGRFLGSTITAGNSFVIPQGLIHFGINRSCNQSQFIASFGTRDQGTQTTLASLFRDDVPTDALRATTGLSDDDIAIIREKVKKNPNPSADPECLKRCFGSY